MRGEAEEGRENKGRESSRNGENGCRGNYERGSAISEERYVEGK